MKERAIYVSRSIQEQYSEDLGSIMIGLQTKLQEAQFK